MTLVVNHRAGAGQFKRALKRVVKRALTFHLPVNRLTRPLFQGLYLVHVGVRGGWHWACRYFWSEPLFRSQCFSVGRGFRMDRLPSLTGQGRIILGDAVRLDGRSTISFSSCLRSDPELHVGNDTFIGDQCSFTVADSVHIGDHCLLAPGVAVRDHDGHPLDASCRRAKKPSPTEGIKPVRIGDDVWIGTRATILKGVSIGDRAVVAAASVVTRDVPPDVVVAGNPAQIVKQLT
jgi:maltose O-acetyltransferase